MSMRILNWTTVQVSMLSARREMIDHYSAAYSVVKPDKLLMICISTPAHSKKVMSIAALNCTNSIGNVNSSKMSATRFVIVGMWGVCRYTRYSTSRVPGKSKLYMK
jgi:hypothetical protein